MLDFLKFFLPLAGAAFAWHWNERRKIVAAEYERKAEKYAALIDSLQGFLHCHRCGSESRVESEAPIRAKQVLALLPR